MTLACVLAISLGSITPSVAADEYNSLNVIADIFIVRPGCFVATILGSAAFVVALPVAAISRSVPSTAHTLVVIPAKATFSRPVGDMDDLMDY
jgi:hypothetical protein